MTLDAIQRLLEMLTKNGVTYYKGPEIELHLETARPFPLQGPSAAPPADNYEALMGRKVSFPGKP